MARVLVVDDSLSVRKMVERALETKGLEVVAASSETEAMERLDSTMPDLVVCDVVMPDVDGYRICETVRTHPVLSHTPVLLISGIVNSAVLDRAPAQAVHRGRSRAQGRRAARLAQGSRRGSGERGAGGPAGSQGGAGTARGHARCASGRRGGSRGLPHRGVRRDRGGTGSGRCSGRLSGRVVGRYRTRAGAGAAVEHDPRLRGRHVAPPRGRAIGHPHRGAARSDLAREGPLLHQEVSPGIPASPLMPRRARSSHLMSPWAWLAALAAGCLVLASSTALYAINPGLQLDLPWWSAVVAPALVYALVLPLCVARIRVGGWLVGFGLLAALHLGLGMATAWLYAQVSFVSIRETLAPAFWSFAPALVLEMVGALLMTLPFLS